MPIPEPDASPEPSTIPPQEFFDLLKKFQPEPSEWKHIINVLSQVAMNRGNDASIQLFAAEIKLEETELRQLWEFTRVNKDLFIGSDSEVLDHFRQSWPELGIRQSEVTECKQDIFTIGQHLKRNE